MNVTTAINDNGKNIYFPPRIYYYYYCYYSGTAQKTAKEQHLISLYDESDSSKENEEGIDEDNASTEDLEESTPAVSQTNSTSINEGEREDQEKEEPSSSNQEHGVQATGIKGEGSSSLDGKENNCVTLQ